MDQNLDTSIREIMSAYAIVPAATRGESSCLARIWKAKKSGPWTANRWISWVITQEERDQIHTYFFLLRKIKFFSGKKRKKEEKTQIHTCCAEQSKRKRNRRQHTQHMRHDYSAVCKTDRIRAFFPAKPPLLIPHEIKINRPIHPRLNPIPSSSVKNTM